MARQNRKVLLFIDNYCAHPQIHSLRAVTLKFLPPNTTAVIQPCDAGIIKNLKYYYRKMLMRSMLTWYEPYDSGKDKKEFQITLLDAMVIRVYHTHALFDFNPVYHFSSVLRYSELICAKKTMGKLF